MRNVFVAGLEPLGHRLLRTISSAEDCRFLELFDYGTIVRPPEASYPPLMQLVDEGARRIAGFEGQENGILGYWDFPTSVLVPLLATRLGLPGPTLEAVARCEHKYWSRLEQQKVLPDWVPRFQAVDPFAADAVGAMTLDYPFWIKPVKAHSSFLGFYIDTPETLEARLAVIRERIGFMGEPFNEFLAQIDMPAELRSIDGYHCIAEELISGGHQCTLEGYSWRGSPEVYGVVDSLRTGRYDSCFSRYQYPSVLPEAVQSRLRTAACELIRHLGYDGGAFNIEFYWNPDDDSVSVLEVNARISRSHSALFLMVDGEVNQAVPLDLAFGRCPTFPHRAGGHNVAAKFMVRQFSDGVLERVPTDADIRRFEEAFPEAWVRVLTPAGTRLGDLRLQDSYSYEIAEIFLGAENEEALLQKYSDALLLLDFQVRPLAPETAP
ncbi:D-alanine--D-alanine ligase [Aquisalimonas sp.]|uniref:ATP-grasp domain-containing protein n=1 Tax=Aquisalimonas sp. TaxID=1872621 RepID=UPI0025C405F3|nr:D-alanine--D-alanine ligase [Aquisalimonas sp.]